MFPAAFVILENIANVFFNFIACLVIDCVIVKVKETGDWLTLTVISSEMTVLSRLIAAAITVVVALNAKSSIVSFLYVIWKVPPAAANEKIHTWVSAVPTAGVVICNRSLFPLKWWCPSIAPESCLSNLQME